MNFTLNLLFQESTDSNLTYAMSFLPLARSSAMLHFYGNIEGKQLCDGITEIVAMDFGKTFDTGNFLGIIALIVTAFKRLASHFAN